MIPKQNRASPPLRVVQISDSHLFREPTTELLGLNTEESLERVLELVAHEQPNIDLILVTGDVSQDGSPESYLRFLAHIEQFNKPVFWLPGNHDEFNQMQALVADGGNVSPCTVDRGPWRIVMLDSTLPGEAAGAFSTEQLAFLESALAEASARLDLRHVMVCLHHHPVPLGSRWLDGVGLKNPERFLEIIDNFPIVRSIICGHVHQASERMRDHVWLYSTPSTCFQFKPKSQGFAVCDSAPGYRWFDLHASGEIRSGVSRPDSYAFQIDYSVKGY